ncbi:MAG: VWA domain-containing protein [Verrucomicrobiales bacterium]|nr:VWA domain-containing protein [Verrucomicrobiales bacterium]
MMDFSHPHFEATRWLWLAVVAPLLLAWLHRRAAVKRKQQLAQIASPRFVGELAASHSPARRRIKNFLLLLAFAFAGIALARPQWGELKSSGQWLGEDVVFVLDGSYSMLSTDVRPNRLQRAKLAISNFVRAHGRGRVGLVTFAGGAFLNCPLTLDYDAFENALQAVDEKTIPIPGTDIGRALQEANRAMEKTSRRKLVVLLTDGEDLERGGVATAKTLGTNGVVVFSVGVGSPAGSEIQMLNPAGQMDYVRDAKGEVVRSRLDEKTLAAIAQATGGNYYPLGPLGEGLAKVRSAVETLDRSAELKHSRSRGIDRYYWAVAVMLALLVGESLTGTRRRQRGDK